MVFDSLLIVHATYLNLSIQIIFFFILISTIGLKKNKQNKSHEISQKKKMQYFPR